MSSFTSSFNRFFGPFLISILLLVGLEGALFGHPTLRNFLYYFSGARVDDAMRFEIKIRNMRQDRSAHKVFFVGPSLVRENFDERWFNVQFEDRGISFYNLGLAGAAPIDIWMIRQRLIKANPDLIVYMPYIGNFFEDYDLKRMRSYFNPEIIGEFRQHFGWRFLQKNWFQFFDSELASFSKLYRYRDSLASTLFAAMSESLFPWTREGERPKRFAYKNSKPQEYFFKKIKESEGKQFYKSNFTPLEMEKFTDILQSFLAAGIKVALINPPMHPLVDQTYSKEVGEAYNHYLQEQADHLKLPYLSESQSNFLSQEQYFIDFTHLNAEGRAVFAEFISGWLEDQNLLPRE